MNPLTKDLADSVEAMDLHPRTKRNVRMQYRLAVNTIIPWLKRAGVMVTEPAVCEIGCAEGGVLAAFSELGAVKALGTDIQGALLTQISRPIWESLAIPMEFSLHDVIYEDIPDQWQGVFDIVLLRDVIEHLDDPSVALKNISRLLKPGGVVVVTFPPYTSAFGGHQQLTGTIGGALPFIHMLPWFLFKHIVEAGDPTNKEELERLHSIRCSAIGVAEAAGNAGLNIIDERYFALRPVFKWKYQIGIPVFEVTKISSLPFVKSLAMEAAFLLQKPR